MFSKKSPVLIRDNVLPPKLFERWRQFYPHYTYEDVVNPVDGVTYPGICTYVPKWVDAFIRVSIVNLLDQPIRKINAQFLRLTTEDTPPAPHGAHNDAAHAKYSAFFYLNPAPAGVRAGTSLLTHTATRMTHAPRSVEEWEAWDRDTNDYDAWEIDELIEWRENRLAIYEADRMHRAEPPEGWGKDASDGRLVLITFFS